MLIHGCSIRENDQNCKEPPIYRLELVDCTACREEGFSFCTGHRACVTHGADLRADELLFRSDDRDVKILRISSLAVP